MATDAGGFGGGAGVGIGIGGGIGVGADVAGVTFKDFIENKAADGSAGKFSFVLRGYVKKWISEIDAELAHVQMLQEITSGGRAPNLV